MKKSTYFNQTNHFIDQLNKLMNFFLQGNLIQKNDQEKEIKLFYLTNEVIQLNAIQSTIQRVQHSKFELLMLK